MFDEEKEDALEEKADRKLHEIRDGDRECVICGLPSYAMLDRKVYCKKHFHEKLSKKP